MTGTGGLGGAAGRHPEDGMEISLPNTPSAADLGKAQAEISQYGSLLATVPPYRAYCMINVCLPFRGRKRIVPIRTAPDAFT